MVYVQLDNRRAYPVVCLPRSPQSQCSEMWYEAEEVSEGRFLRQPTVVRLLVDDESR